MGLRKGQGNWTAQSAHLLAGERCCTTCTWRLSAEGLAALKADALAGSLPDDRFGGMTPQPVSHQLVAQCKDSQLQSTAFNTNAVQLFEIKTRRRQARRSIAGVAGVRSKQPMLSGVLQAAPVSQAISAQ